MGKISSIKSAVGLAVACSALVSCGVVESPLIPGSQAAAAKNQVMMVRAAPPSFGYERLVTRCGEFPDLAVFVTKKGVPDFLAEAGTWERPYLILYYLERRGAFVCRTKAENRKAIEFSGPYPITEKEYRLLHGFQSNAERKREKQAARQIST